MSKDLILETLRGFDGVLELAPAEGDGYPELARGDHFFYYAPDGRVPERRQPYATIVTKDYPGDTLSDLDPPGRWRLNVHVGRDAVTRLAGGGTPADPSTADVLLPHPLYARQGWIAVVNPGNRTAETLIALLSDAHDRARRHAAR